MTPLSTPDETALPVVVAIGSSAGGIEPALALISQLPKTGDYCVVLAQHLSPTNASILPELVQRRTSLRCKSIEHWEQLTADTVYVTPPGHDVVIEEDRLLLRRGPRRITPQPSIDQLFESLDTSGLAPRTIAVVLSGLGADGSQGLRRLSRGGALTLVQRPVEAGSPDMPEAALATGCVDFCGSVDQLAAAVTASVARLARPPALPDRSQLQALIVASEAGGGEYSLARFSDASLGQAALRRMALVGASSLPAYAELISRDPRENSALLAQVLQPQGSFDQSQPLRQRLLSTLAEQYRRWPGPESFRAWCLGCSSGEEAYAMAFALEDLRRQEQCATDFLIYATDLLPEQVSLARAGSYTQQELLGLPEPVASRYLGRRLRHYQVNLDLRRKLLFSVHDALEHGSWPALNFVSCLGVLPRMEEAHGERLALKLNTAVRHGGVVFTETTPAVL